jgi:hypothetical protein
MSHENLSRRAILAGAASVPALAVPIIVATAAPIVATATEPVAIPSLIPAARIEPDPIFAIIEAVRATGNAINTSTTDADWDDLSDAWQNAQSEFRETAPTTRDGLIAYLEFALSDYKCVLEPGSVEYFVRTIARSVRIAAVRS